MATWFTFLPSFLFILAGGPLVESTHGELKFTAPLTAITAAVVGVIVNLAVFFAYHVLWPAGLAGRFDAASALIGIAAAVALFRYQGRRDSGDPGLWPGGSGNHAPSLARYVVSCPVNSEDKGADENGRQATREAETVGRTFRTVRPSNAA